MSTDMSNGLSARATWLKDHWEELQNAEESKRDCLLVDYKSKESRIGDVTILGYAVVKKSTNVFAYLLRKRASEASEDLDLDVNKSFKTSGDIDNIPILHLAAYTGNVEAVEELLRSADIQVDRDAQIACSASTIKDKLKNVHDCTSLGSNGEVNMPEVHAPFLSSRAARVVFKSSEVNTGLTALHCAAIAGQSAVIRAFVENISSPTKSLNFTDHEQMTPLHYAAGRGDIATVEELLKSDVVRGTLEEKSCKLTPLDMVCISIQCTKDHGFEQQLKTIKYLLLQREDVKEYLDSLRRDRQIFLNATNGILVGAALIASITFAGCLHPPFGYLPYYEEQYLLKGLAPADAFATYVAVGQHPDVQVFWIFNSLAFFHAIAALLTGANAVLPIAGQQVFERAEFEHICNMHIRTSVILSASSIFALAVFMAAGFVSLPPSMKYQFGMLGTSLFGAPACLIGLVYYWRRLSRLMQLEKVKGGFLKKIYHCVKFVTKNLHD